MVNNFQTVHSELIERLNDIKKRKDVLPKRPSKSAVQKIFDDMVRLEDDVATFAAKSKEIDGYLKQTHLSIGVLDGLDTFLDKNLFIGLGSALLVTINIYAIDKISISLLNFKILVLTFIFGLVCYFYSKLFDFLVSFNDAKTALAKAEDVIYNTDNSKSSSWRSFLFYVSLTMRTLAFVALSFGVSHGLYIIIDLN